MFEIDTLIARLDDGNRMNRVLRLNALIKHKTNMIGGLVSKETVCCVGGKVKH